MILAWLLHAVYSTVIAYLLSSMFGALSPWIAGLSLAFGAILGSRHARAFTANDPGFRFFRFHPGEAGWMERALAAFVLFAAYRHFTWLLFPMDFHWASLNQNNLGDLPLHINFIREFANGVNFPPKNPIFSAELLRYPYGVDLYNALWEAVGVRLQAHLMGVGFLSTLVSIVMLRRFGGWWAIGAFFLSGGLNGWEILSTGRLTDYQSYVDWKNLFLAVYVTQRGMLFALPLGLWLLISLRAYLSGETSLTKGQLFTLGIVWGFLPFFHLHAFVIVTLLMIAIAAECGGRGGVRAFLRSRMTWIAFLPATWFILFSTKFFSAAGVSHLEWGWTFGEWVRNKKANFWDYLILDFGPWLFVPVVLAGLLYFSKDLFERDRRRRLAIELAIDTVVFILFFNVILAPWAWDNIKILIWPYLGFARLLWIVFEPRLDTALGYVERPVLAFMLFLSGAVAIANTLQSPPGRAVPIYAFGTLASAEGALSGVPKSAVFAAATTYQHPLAYFGRLRVLGYLGHVASHGLDYQATEAKLNKIMSGDPDYVNLARELGVTHIFYGPDERANYGEGDRPWMRVLPNVSRVKGFEIYALK